MTLLSIPELWKSEIIVFQGDSYFKTFFHRNSKDQKWIPLTDARKFQQQWNLSIPENMQITGFKQIIDDEDGYYEGELWLIGELK